MDRRELRYVKAKELRVAKADDGTRSITGYAACFNVQSLDFGGWSEMISPSAFTRTLQDNPDVLCLYDHSTAAVLGRTKSSTLALEVDSVGLKFTCKLPATTVASDLAVSIDRGDIEGCSFGFVCESDVWTSMVDGSALRTLLDVTLYEVTITSSPAYTDTSVSFRNAPKEVRSRIVETRKKAKAKRDDGADAADSDSGCGCDCGPCSDGDCDGCTNADCMDPDCLCDTSTRSYRNRAHMLIAVASHRLS